MSLVHGPQPNNIIIGGLPHSSLTAYKHSTVYSLLYVGLPFFEVGDAIHLVAETNRIDVVSIKVLVEDDDEHARNATILIQVRFAWALGLLVL